MFPLIFNGSQIMSEAPRDTGCDMTDETVSTNTTSCDLAEIVEEIMDNLRPWTRPEPEVQAGIQQTIEFLQREIPHKAFRYDRSAIKQSAEQVGDAIAELERSLQRIHPIVEDALFPPREVMPPKLALERMPLEPPSDFCVAQNKLRQWRTVCGQLVRNPGGAHPNFDHAKRGCAWCALGLMRRCSQQTPTGTAEGPFRTISSLLYQATSGKRLDLKKACDGVLRFDKEARELIRLEEIRWAKAGCIKVDGVWYMPPGGWPDDENDAPPL
jgi:hypothetical protein